MLSHRMAHGKGQGSLFVIFTVTVTLIHCKSLSHLFEPQTTSDEGDEILSDQYVAEEGGYFEPVTNSEYLSDDGDVSDLLNSVVQGELVRSEAAWDAMSPKLRCGGDLMMLQLSGPGVAQVELCRGNDAPVPLTQLPPHCGHTTPTYGGIVYATPYDGCGVVQQGGSYVIQMLWRGNLAVIACPMTASAENETMPGHPLPGFLQIVFPHSSGSTYDSPLQTPPDTLSPTETTELEPFPGYLQGFPHHVSWPSNYPHFHPGAVHPNAMAPNFKPAGLVLEQLQPQLPGYTQMLWPYNYPHYHHHHHQHGTPKPTASTLVPTQEPTEKPQLPGYTQMLWPYDYPHYHHHHHHHQHGMPKPTEKPSASVPTATTAQEPTRKPQLPGYTQMLWPYDYPHYHHHHGTPKPTEKPSASVPTATTAQEPTRKPQLPGYTQMLWPYDYPHYHHHHGTPKPTKKPSASVPTATTAQEPTRKPQLPGYTQMLWPYDYPHYHHHHGTPKPTKKPSASVPTATTAQEPTRKPQLPGYTQMLWPYDYPHYHHHHQHGTPKPTKKPSASVPTATTAQEPTRKPQLPGYTQMLWPYDYPHYHHHHGTPKPTKKPSASVPTATTAQEPTRKPQLPGYTQMLWPYDYPHYHHHHHHYHHGMPKPTTKPASTSVPTTIAQEPTKIPLPEYTQMFWPYDHSHYHVHPPETQDPTVPPITAAAECGFSANQPPQFPVSEEHPFAHIDDLWEQMSEYDPSSLPL